VNGRDFGDADADFIAAEPRSLVTDDCFVRHLNDGGKKKIVMRPPARLKCFQNHDYTVIQKGGLSKLVLAAKV
jgi:hypothetical protein